MRSELIEPPPEGAPLSREKPRSDWDLEPRALRKDLERKPLLELLLELLEPPPVRGPTHEPDREPRRGGPPPVLGLRGRVGADASEEEMSSGLNDRTPPLVGVGGTCAGPATGPAGGRGGFRTATAGVGFLPKPAALNKCGFCSLSLLSRI